MALAALGDEPAAIAALTSALDLGCPQGYVRVFADEGTAMAAVLVLPLRPSAAISERPGSRWPAWPGCNARSATAIRTRPAARPTAELHGSLAWSTS